MTPTINPNAVVVDANILISICSKEQDTYSIADEAFKTMHKMVGNFLHLA